jgi:hypothetical protein
MHEHLLRNNKEIEMRINKFALLLGLVITAILFAEVAAHASGIDQYTRITFSQPVEIPGQILPAGTYLFRVPYDNPNVVQIASAAEARVYVTLFTNATERLMPSGNTVLVLAEPQAGMPVAVEKWFYPGDSTGHEFVYSKQEQEQLGQSQQETVIAKDASESGD